MIDKVNNWFIFFYDMLFDLRLVVIYVSVLVFLMVVEVLNGLMIKVIVWFIVNINNFIFLVLVYRLMCFNLSFFYF